MFKTITRPKIRKENRFSPSCWQEYLPEFISRIPIGTFKNFASHWETHPNKLIPNTAYFYCMGQYLSTSAGIAIEKENVEIQTKDGVSDNTFYDIRIKTDPFVPYLLRNSKKLYIIKVDKRFAGWYDKEQNILYATDWTHSSESTENAIEVMEKLISLSIVAPVIKEEEEEPEEPLYNEVLMLGADPEFEGIRGGMVISASSITPGTGEDVQLGADGAGGPVEIRPKPARSPEDLVNNINAIIQKASKKYDALSVRGDTYAIGGHIHFSTPPIKEFIDLIDDFLGIMDTQNGTERRDYAIRKAYREAHHGGTEYRTLPAAWMVNPEIARITCKICYNLMELFYKKNTPITYEAPIKKSEYISIAGLIPEEADTFIEFLWGKNRLQYADILAAWTGNNKRRRIFKMAYCSELNCNDTWEEGVRDDVLRLFNYHHIPATFFGWNANRGPRAISGLSGLFFSRHLWNHVEIPTPSFRGTTRIGLPHAFRMGLWPYRSRSKRIKIIREMIKFLKFDNTTVDAVEEEVMTSTNISTYFNSFMGDTQCAESQE